MAHSEVIQVDDYIWSLPPVNLQIKLLKKKEKFLSICIAIQLYLKQLQSVSINLKSDCWLQKSKSTT